MPDQFPQDPSILVVGGPLDTHEVKLQQGTTLMIGSGRLAHLRLDHPDIELAHVKVTWDDLGISMIDNGSRKGTWVNGDPVETTALIDGDVISFVSPGTPTTAPRIRLKIPKGSVPEPPPPPPPPPPPVGARPAPAAGPARTPSRTARKRGRGRVRLPDMRLVAVVLGGLLLLAGAGWAIRFFFFTAPSAFSIQPAQCEPGSVVTISGARFSGEAARNTVWFGATAVPADSVAGDALQVKVPVQAVGRLSVSVESPSGRSRGLPLLVLAPLRAMAVDPAGALPGDEVTLTGKGFTAATTATVGGKAARISSYEDSTLRLEVPALDGPRGSRQMVIVTESGRSTVPLPLYLGRVPLVLSFDPPRASGGELVRLRGIGFAADADANGVAFDGVPALVVASSTTELAVVAPIPTQAQAETLARVVLQAQGRTSSDGLTYPLLRLVEGAWVPHFQAGSAGEGARGQAVVGTEIAPVLLLSWKDESRSVAQRAVQVAARLSAAVDRVRVGQKVSFEVRRQPVIGVGVVGDADLVVQASPQDAAAYAAPAGVPPRGEPPAPVDLARHWAELLNAWIMVGTSGAEPAAGSPAVVTAFHQLRAAVPWQYGTGVSSARAAAVPPELRRKLREAALRVP